MAIESIHPARQVGCVRQYPIHVKQDWQWRHYWHDGSHLPCCPSSTGGFRRSGDQHFRVQKIELRTFEHYNNIFKKYYWSKYKMNSVSYIIQVEGQSSPLLPPSPNTRRRSKLKRRIKRRFLLFISLCWPVRVWWSRKCQVYWSSSWFLSSNNM